MTDTSVTPPGARGGPQESPEALAVAPARPGVVTGAQVLAACGAVLSQNVNERDLNPSLAQHIADHINRQAAMNEPETTKALNVLAMLVDSLPRQDERYPEALRVLRSALGAAPATTGTPEPDAWGIVGKDGKVEHVQWGDGMEDFALESVRVRNDAAEEWHPSVIANRPYHVAPLYRAAPAPSRLREAIEALPTYGRHGECCACSSELGTPYPRTMIFRDSVLSVLTAVEAHT